MRGQFGVFLIRKLFLQFDEKYRLVTINSSSFDFSKEKGLT